jgi:hypothetical protein
MSEALLHQQVADYLRLQHPDVLFHSDFGSGVKLTMGQAVKQKRLNGGRRAWPDLFIAEVKEVICGSREAEGFYVSEWGGGTNIICGLFLELKKEDTRLKKKDGSWATEHIAEQAAVGEELRKRGYKFEFAVGFDEAKEIIDEYLGGKNE